MKEYLEKNIFLSPEYKVEKNVEYGFIKYNINEYGMTGIFRTLDINEIQKMKNKKWFDVVCIFRENKQLNFFNIIDI